MRVSKQKIRKEMMSLSQIAEYFGLHRQTIGRLARNKEIPAMRIGNEWRFDLTKVEQALYKKQNEGHPS